MKAIKEVGLKKITVFIFFTFWEVVFKLLLFSPLRIYWLKLFGAKIGSNTIFGNVHFMNLYRKGIPGIQIGKRCYIGDHVTLDLADSIILEDDVTLAEEVFILTHTNVGYHDHPLQKEFKNHTESVRVANGSFIGIRSTILPGINIGEKSAVGACALVTRDIPPGELHVGVPAKLLRKLI
jgi:acetyltransferase-like isoleucine patch superfamily enzyme